MTVDRKWLPIEWVDEWSPPCRPQPDDFIVADGASLVLGYGVMDKDIDDSKRGTFRRAIVPGDIVNFLYMDSFGEFDVTVKGDGSFVAQATVPEGANWFWVSGADVCGDSLAEIAKQYVAFGLEIEPDTVSVACCHHGTQAFRLLAGSDDRAPHFEMVSEAEARQ